MSGLERRMKRLLRPSSGRTVLVPMDHGITMGSVPGLENIRTAVTAVAEGGADGVVLHKGMARAVADVLPGSVSLVVHLSASTMLGNSGHKVCVCSVEEALRLGADAVSVHINVGDETEPEQLRELGRVSDACHAWGMPLLVMAYPRGPRISDEYAPGPVLHAVRVAAELGADVIKTNYTGDCESFRRVVEHSPVPVLIAGGGGTSMDLLTVVEDALAAGAAGVSIGRHAFGHRTPAAFIQSLVRTVHEGRSVAAALALT